MPGRNHLRVLLRGLPFLCWVFALGVAGYQAWTWRDWMSIDGVCYLDMADAFRDGVWKDTINGVWSPLYSAVLAAGLTVLELFGFSEFQAVHAINFAIFVAALTCYEYLLRQAFASGRQTHERLGAEPLPAWLWYATARILFVWTTATMVPVHLLTPDLLASAVMYTGIGLLLRLTRGRGSTRTAAVFGAVLGLGYLAKAILFPLAFVMLGMLWMARRRSQSGWSRFGTASAVFAMVAGPYVTALSIEKGRITFSDVGKLNYAWHVNGLPPIHWQGGREGHGTPLHPTRQIHDSPPIYEFDGPVGGTVPAWYDPSYWYEGVGLRFSYADQIETIAESVKIYWRIFALSLVGFLVLPAVSLVLADVRKSFLRLIGAQWIYLLVVGMALVAYGLIHVEGRYIGAFAILFSVAALNVVAMPGRGRGRRLLLLLAAAWFIVLTAKAVHSGFRRPPAIVDRVTRLATEVSDELAVLGVRKGDRIATLTATPGRWDRMLGVKVAVHAEWWRDGVEEAFWALSPESRQEIYRRLADLELQGIVLEEMDEPVNESGWRQLGDTKHYWRPLPVAGFSPTPDPPRSAK